MRNHLPLKRIQFAASLSVLLFVSEAVHSQSSRFDVQLVINVASAERVVLLCESGTGNGRDIAQLPGSRIATATTALLAQRRLSDRDLEEELEGAKFGNFDRENIFRLRETRSSRSEIKELLNEIKVRNFGGRVVSTVEQMFPANTSIAAQIPVFFTSFGHENIDAFVRRVSWRDGVPVFVGEGEGELTIVVNLAKAVTYGRNLDERFIGTLSVVAHEVFHAAFGAYRDKSPVYRNLNNQAKTYLDLLLDLTHDEGIAHLLTFEQRTRGYLPRDWDERTRSSIEEFNRSAEKLLSPRIAPSQASHLIRSSNTSAYWDSYGAITGLFIAREIDRQLGRPSLTATISAGPYEFFRVYDDLSRRDRVLPRLSEVIVRHISRYPPE